MVVLSDDSQNGLFIDFRRAISWTNWDKLRLAVGLAERGEPLGVPEAMELLSGTKRQKGQKARPG